jgi:MoaA/NifB/PqqE/SkfB family radical SAM enzyme
MATRFLQVEPTTKCNFTCGYCCGRAMPQQHMSMDMFRQTLDRFPEATHVQIQGEGEPLLNPHFFEMADLCRRRGIDVSCITNGSLITPKAAAEFVRLRFRRVNISIDSPDPVVFQKIRGGKLAAVIKGVNRLMQAVRAAHVEQPLVGLSVTVLRSTVSAHKRIRELYDQLGLTGGIKSQLLSRMPPYIAVYKEHVADELVDTDERDAFYSGWSSATTCAWLEEGAYVNCEGHVTACCQIKHYQHFGLGHVGTHTLAQIEQQREASNGELSRGLIPHSCEGCALATMVASRHGRGTRTIELQDVTSR